MGQRSLITGASSGIGLAAMRALVASGSHVIAIARRGDRLEAAAREATGPGTVETHAADASDPDALQAVVGAGPLDLVIASAGTCRQARLDEPDAVSVWQDTMATNLDGVFHALRLTGPLLRAGGSFVAVSSGLGKNARAAYGAYCASKHAVLGLVKCAALELAPRGVRVNAVCPGWVDTPMSAADIAASARRAGVRPAALRSEIVASLPLGAPVGPSQVADLILWLASPRASAITGQSYNISGGEFFN